MNREIPENIHQHIPLLWDRLAEWPAARSEQALQFLLEGISELIDADHSYWLSALRMAEPETADPMLGWRPGPAFYCREQPIDQQSYRRAVKEIETGDVGESTYNHVRGAGHFRATLLRDHVSAAFFDSAHYRAYYQAAGIADTLFVVAPVNCDTEVYFCFNRFEGQPPFAQSQVDIASYALRSLKWFHKQVLLSHGLLIAETPLTPTEKRVMKQLLTDLTEKQIADKLGQKVDTTHKHVTAIYRKFNVNSRAALMAAWLGHQPT